MPNEEDNNGFQEFYDHLRTTNDPTEVLSAIVACAIKRRVTPHNISELERGIKEMQAHIVKTKAHLAEVNQMIEILDDKATDMQIPKDLIEGLVNGAIRQVEKTIAERGPEIQSEKMPEERPQIKTARHEEMDDSIQPPSAWLRD